MKHFMKRTVYTAGISAAVAAAALGLGGCAAGTQMPDTLKVQNVDAAENVITVTGREEVKVVPDMARIEYAVYTREDTAAACQEKNASDLNAAIETLKGLGVEETSIQTSSYGLSPIRNWNSDKQEIIGYEMTTNLTVSDIPIDNAGTIITKSVAAGVNGINSVSYFSSSYDASYQEALKGAMAVAQACLLYTSLTMSICGCSLKESYKHVILGTMIPAAVAGLVIALMATFGITF